MDFFAHQEAALRASRWLIVLFLIAVAAVLASINALFAFLLDASNLELHLWVTLGTLVVMAGGALFSLLGFAGSGRSVAEALGGREVDPETRDPDERRLLHVVEEMAIASGVPRPPVYILDEEGINAFAAGYRIDDAAIGVTKGLLALPRDQIQGVIAHEYSHILHGDMRLNMRLIAVLAGLMAVAGVGRFLMQAALRSAAAASGNRRSSGALPFLLLGLAIFVIGLLGWFFGRLIQAAISRRREYLADASAVQYTRNPEGIAGALEHILRRGSAVSAERAADAAHLFFAQALSGLFATHPPLAERIARIRGRPVEGPASTAAVGAAPAGHGALAPAQLVASAGALDRQQLNRAERVLAQLPPAVVEAAHQPFSARAVALLPLLARREAPRERQLAAVARHDPALAAELRRLWPHWSQADATAVRWPLLQLVLPLLGSLSLGQRRQLLAVAEALATDDGIVTVAEYIVLRRLQR
ncbi:MAG: M48 family metallopeptidase, partial [Planctomycetes bacterium]|nr:M48 family metallopeptidase [Planctomycetota bacterium]